MDNRLLHIYSDEKGTYIGGIKNGHIVPVYSFDFEFYAVFNQSNEKGQQVIGLNIPTSNFKEILIIDKKHMNFHFIN